MEMYSNFLLKLFLTFILSVLAILDLKTKETPYFLSFSLILSGVLSLIINLLTNFQISLIEIYFINLLSAFFISFFKYKLGFWGGGDFLVFVGTSFFITILFPFLFSPLLFLIFIYIATLFYNTFYLIFIYLKENFISKYEIIFFVLLLASLISKNFFLSLFILIIWLFIVLHKLNTLYFIKKIPVKNLKEEDWLAYEVYKNNEVILKPSDVKEGLTKEHIKLLKEKNVKFVYIKDGIPYLPTFLLGFLLMLFFSNKIFEIMSLFFYF
jgi:Flp pilus assembly protein protease CpaA